MPLAMDEFAQRIIQFYYDDDERAYSRICNELEKAEKTIAEVVTVPLLPHQHQALLSMLADIHGGFARARFGDFKTSTLLKALNAKQIQLAASDFFHFVYVDGLVSQRLWIKRNAEQVLFRRGTLILRD